MTTSPSSVLIAEGLTYTYAGNPALGDVSLTLAAADLTVLVGRNGAGKSTLLRCLAGWTRSQEGEVVILGASLSRDERRARRHLALVPDTPPFYADLTAWEHLQLVGQAHRLAGWPKRAEQLLGDFGLLPARSAFPLGFSRGMRQKLAICLALLIQPRVLLLDEPCGALDPLAASALWQELRRARSAGLSVLLSTHQLPPEAVANR